MSTMSAIAHHAINSLFSRFVYDCKRFRSNQEELRKLAEPYFRYRDLLHEQERTCDDIVKIFGVLGVHSPDVSEDLAKLISSGISQSLADLIYTDVAQVEPITINSAKVRDHLKLWQILELFLSSVDNQATLSDFRSFLFELDMKDKATPQAIESAIKTHPELFEERVEGGQRFFLLRRPALWIQTWEVILRSIRARVRQARQEYAPDAESIELIEQPARTVVIRTNRVPGATVQASISLKGDQIQIKTQENRSHGKYSESDFVKIQLADSAVVYIHEGHRISGPEEVAEIILAPILDCYRAYEA